MVLKYARSIRPLPDRIKGPGIQGLVISANAAQCTGSLAVAGARCIPDVTPSGCRLKSRLHSGGLGRCYAPRKSATRLAGSLTARLMYSAPLRPTVARVFAVTAAAALVFSGGAAAVVAAAIGVTFVVTTIATGAVTSLLLFLLITFSSSH